MREAVIVAATRNQILINKNSYVSVLLLFSSSLTNRMARSYHIQGYNKKGETLMARAQWLDFFCGENLAFIVFLILILLVIGFD
jgi:hypothetical protein